MAYIKEISLRCSTPYCARKAVAEVYNKYNARQEQFCRLCAKTRMKQLQARGA
jgi:transposase-like protein